MKSNENLLVPLKKKFKKHISAEVPGWRPQGRVQSEEIRPENKLPLFLESRSEYNRDLRYPKTKPSIENKNFQVLSKKPKGKFTVFLANPREECLDYEQKKEFERIQGKNILLGEIVVKNDPIEVKSSIVLSSSPMPKSLSQPYIAKSKSNSISYNNINTGFKGITPFKRPSQMNSQTTRDYQKNLKTVKNNRLQELIPDPSSRTESAIIMPKHQTLLDLHVNAVRSGEIQTKNEAKILLENTISNGVVSGKESKNMKKFTLSLAREDRGVEEKNSDFRDKNIDLDEMNKEFEGKNKKIKEKNKDFEGRNKDFKVENVKSQMEEKEFVEETTKKGLEDCEREEKERKNVVEKDEKKRKFEKRSEKKSSTMIRKKEGFQKGSEKARLSMIFDKELEKSPRNMKLNVKNLLSVEIVTDGNAMQRPKTVMDQCENMQNEFNPHLSINKLEFKSPNQNPSKSPQFPRKNQKTLKKYRKNTEANKKTFVNNPGPSNAFSLKIFKKKEKNLQKSITVSPIPDNQETKVPQTSSLSNSEIENPEKTNLIRVPTLKKILEIGQNGGILPSSISSRASLDVIIEDPTSNPSNLINKSFRKTEENSKTDKKSMDLNKDFEIFQKRAKDHKQSLGVLKTTESSYETHNQSSKNQRKSNIIPSFRLNLLKNDSELSVSNSEEQLEKSAKTLSRMSKVIKDKKAFVTRAEDLKHLGKQLSKVAKRQKERPSKIVKNPKEPKKKSESSSDDSFFESSDNYSSRSDESIGDYMSEIRKKSRNYELNQLDLLRASVLKMKAEENIENTKEDLLRKNTEKVEIYSESESNDTVLDIESEMQTLFKEKCFTLNKFAFSPQIAFNFPMKYEAGRSENINDIEVNEYNIDSAAFNSNLLRKRFLGVNTADNFVARQNRKLEILELEGMLPIEVHYKRLKLFEKMRKRDRNAQTRGKVVEIGGKPKLTFSNLTQRSTRKSKSKLWNYDKDLVKSGGSNLVNDELHSKERIYCRVKNIFDLDFLSLRRRGSADLISKHLDENVGILGKIRNN